MFTSSVKMKSIIFHCHPLLIAWFYCANILHSEDAGVLHFGNQVVRKRREVTYQLYASLQGQYRDNYV